MTRLENVGVKTAKANKLAAAQPVQTTYFAIYKKDGLSEAESMAKWTNVVERARQMIALASDDDSPLDPNEEIDDSSEDESEETEDSTEDAA